MKKFGFTLAEVLITLTIIGVVAALVLPTFTSGVQKKKIGPKLAKAVSVFEQASQAVLDDAQSDSISGAMVLCSNDATELKPLANAECFAYNLSHHIKGSLNGNIITGSDGMVYTIDGFGDPKLFPSNGDPSIYSHENRIAEKIMISLNGGNADGYELFYFNMMDDGTLVPFGSSRGPENEIWSKDENCPNNPDRVPGNPVTCAGHILENNLRVDYK